jgi:hypothetical protein
MKIKQTSKIQYLLLIVVLLLNPIIVSADVLFSEKHSSNVISSVSIESSVKSGSDVVIDVVSEKLAGCHDEGSSASTANKTECCEDLCQCSASGCHASSVPLSFNKSSFEISSHSVNYLRNHYLSYISSPSAPPPIA